MTILRVALLTVLSGTVSGAPAYTFTLNGGPYDPHLLPVAGQRLGAPAPGDHGSVEEIPFVLQEPGAYRFRSEGKPVSRIFCAIDDGPERCVGVHVRFKTQKVPDTDLVGIAPHDPLLDLTINQRRDLWGVRVSFPPADWATSTEGIDWSQIALRFDVNPLTSLADSPAGPSLRFLPPTLRYLTIRYSRPTPAIFPKVSLPDLLFLDLESREVTIDLRILKNASSLRNLNIRGGTIENPQLLAGNSELRFLKLRSLKGLASIGFVRGTPRLRVLKIDASDVTDLRPLAGLNELRLFSANATGITSLPPLDALPALRDLRLHSTPVAKNKETISPLRPKMNVLVKNWDPSIRAFEAQDKKTPPPERPVLFIGSSSIRMWKLEKSFPGVPALNRGFGGSELSDSLRYFDRIVLPYRPRAILLYAGDNDLKNGETAEQVIADYKTFAARIRARLPKAHFAFLPIKPSLSRWALWPEMNKANEAIRKLSLADEHLHYLDTATPMLGKDGKPGKELFAEDGLHLSEAGYKLWDAVVAPWLAKLPQ